jgi:diguanylate cyclase
VESSLADGHQGQTVTGDALARPGRAWRPLAIYAVLQALLLLANYVAPHPANGVIRIVIVSAGTAVFTVGVATRRPQPLAGWSFVAAGAVFELASALAVTAVYGFRPGIDISALVPVVLAGMVLPLYAVGLILLSRVSPYGGVADMVDAVMVAVGGFLLVWTFLVEPALTTSGFNAEGAVVYLVGALVVFAIAIKLVFGGGLGDRSVRLLLLGVFLLLAVTVVALLPALNTSAIRANRPGGELWAFYGAVIGGVGLHPYLTQTRRRREHRARGLSFRRVALYAVLALIAPMAWAVELTASGQRLGRHVFGFSVPIATSAVFLLLLVVRLGLIARLAQGRAGELAGRSAALSKAVSEQEELQKQLAYRAMHDPLTGLSNRTVLTERLDDLLSRPDGWGGHALLLLDLDGFKDINDTLGHPIGDELLVRVAQRLRDSTPAGATLARLGGDEFVVLLENTDPAQAHQYAQALLAAIGRTYSIGGRELFLTTSVGLYNIDQNQPRPTTSDVLRDADLALYAAKEDGKNRITAFHPELREARLEHTRLNAGLRHALVNDEFVLHYQPIIDLESGRIRSVEALLRWRPGRGPLISPADFIPIAETTGIILPIGAWVLRTACQVARRWYEDYQISMSVNVSGRQLDDPGFADTVTAALAESGLPGAGLIIEITESTLVTSSHTPTLHEHLRRLRDFGVKVAIDDFGTGYSSLSYVAELPIDIVKIDKSFTQASSAPEFVPQEWAFTKAILQLVESLHMVAVAEGVETPAQEEALRTLRCPLVQGFHFARPVPAEAIDRTLRGFGPSLTRTPAHARTARTRG